MIAPVATYRLQLRNGVTFAAAQAQLPRLAAWGFSHLYLSPVFTAQTGSTHGYDIVEPATIEPALGGDAGFVALAQAAHAAGLGIILDIVPNHTAFSLENPWLRDVLRHGADSRYADHFDIDWQQRLILPWLAEPFEAMQAQGRIRIDGAAMQADDMSIPLAPGTGGGNIDQVHAAQPWQLTHWVRERDGITHRRFFNVTGLIGMRVEAEHVFDAMHAAVFDLLDRGLIDGLRIDHIDGLADPAAYLDRLKARVGDTPIWVEKILTGTERLPDWGIAGTTGYEAAGQIVRLLTDPAGHARLLAAWQEDTGMPGHFGPAVIEAKHEVLRQDLAAELHQLIALGREAARAAGDEHGDEALREAVIGLLIAFPRYRTYCTPHTAADQDRLLMTQVADTAAEGLRSREVVDLLAGCVTDPASDAAALFQTRFQQVTGALLAKSHEDTAAFRQTAYLATCEVGADPDAATLSPADFEAWCAERSATAMTLTSSHDTKRSEDARMRLVAQSHCPDAALALVGMVGALDTAQAVRPADRWYVAQSALAIWDPADADLQDRLTDHLIKALREAKIVTNWTHPDEQAEAAVLSLARGLVTAWRAQVPEAVQVLIARGEALSLMQLALKLAMPGVPDIYQGCLGPSLALTDPDNRRPVVLPDPDHLGDAPGFAGDKLRLTRSLLRLRRRHPSVFRHGRLTVKSAGDGWIVKRRDGQDILTFEIGTDSATARLTAPFRRGDAPLDA